MHIELLADHTDEIPTIADWYLREWEPYYGPDGPGDAAADLASRCNRDKLPLALVAIESEKLIGVAALDRDTATGLAPSVVGLLVRQEWRRRGVATELLEAATRLAKQLGCNRLYISTTVLGELLLRTGWQRCGSAEFLNAERGSVYVRNL